MSQSQENFWTEGRKEGKKDRRTEGWKDGQILIHRTLPATVGDPISISQCNNGLFTKNNKNQNFLLQCNIFFSKSNKTLYFQRPTTD